MEKKQYLWDLYTAKEEYNSTLVDNFNRNPFWASKNRDIFSPKISEFLLKEGLKPSYPENKKFAICLTHDVDILFNDTTRKQYLKKGVKDLIKLDLSGFVKTLSDSTKRKIIPNFHISETLKHERKYNAKSSFYFLSLSKGEQDYNYDLAEISDVFDQIRENNGEIGLHGGHEAYDNISKMKQEKEKLESIIGEKVHGYRNHYLRFQTPSTWQHLDKLNFIYDTTYGYADCVGFRNGMCHPFQPFDLNENKFLDIIELPLIIMEFSLEQRYMRISESKQFEFCKQMIDTVAKNNGVLTLLWHNTQMQGQQGQLYNAILKYAYEQNAWLTTGNEIVDFWKGNNFHKKTNEILNKLREF